MGVYSLENESICILIESKGAELISIKTKKEEKEYLWHADSAFWGRHSPILFPFVGALQDKQYRYNHVTYPMNQHGFARDKDFSLVSKTENEIWFCMVSDEDTKRVYPFEYELHLGYRLSGNMITVLWKVVNIGNYEMYFSIGGHPGFICPFDLSEARTDYFIQFHEKKQIKIKKLDMSAGLAGYNTEILELKEKNGKSGYLAVTNELFNEDALILEENQIDQISLCRPDGSPYITVKGQMPVYGVWSPAKQNVPFICLEPWFGRCDAAGFTGELKEREWQQQLLPKEIFQAEYQIIVENAGD